MPKGRVLVIDDEPLLREALCVMLNAQGFEAVAEEDATRALARVAEFHPSVIITEVKIEGMDSFGLLRELRSRHPEIAVILLTGEGSVEMALRAIQQEGAYHYFEKPFDGEKLCDVVKRASEAGRAQRESLALQQELTRRGAFGKLIGNSLPMRRVYELIEQVAASSASVLITGESGTGKELGRPHYP
jgi:DNA-binding NtrC family response regulator